MLTAVQLNGQAFLIAVKIEHRGGHRMLAAKLESAETPIAEQEPQQGLRIGLSLAQLTGVGKQVGREDAVSFLPLTPGPSPGGGGE
jgi:hypothetical protein